MSADPLNNLLSIFSSLHGASTDIELHSDYSMRTGAGCFRLAYSPSTHCMALFYARHSDKLAAMKDATGDFGIAHKADLQLVQMYNIHHDRDTKWNINDARQQFDLTWCRQQIAAFDHAVPRILFREACLHADGPDIFGSVFISYKKTPSPEVQGEYNVKIKTKTRDNFRFVDFPEDGDPLAAPRLERGLLGRAFHKAAELITRHFTSTIPLQTGDPIMKERHTVFAEKTVLNAIEADFDTRQRHIDLGEDPVLWREARLLPIYRAGPVLARRIEDFVMPDEDGLEGYVRRFGLLGLHFFLDGGAIEMVKGALEDALGDFGSKEKLKRVPKGWDKLVMGARRVRSIDSALHRRLVRVDPAEFRDLQWLDPSKHAVNFAAAADVTIVDPTPEQAFKSWLLTFLYNRKLSLIQYWGDNFKVQHLRETDKMKVIKINVSNGLVLHFARETQQCYVYFNPSDYVEAAREFPENSADYLKADHVLQIDLTKKDKPMTSIPFATFETELRRLLNATSELKLQGAKQPTSDDLRPRLVQGEAPTSRLKRERRRIDEVFRNLCLTR